VSVHEIDSERPRVRFSHEGAPFELECDVIAGCDGFHGSAGRRSRSSCGFLARLSVRLARDPCRRRAVERGARLRAPRAGFALLSLRSPERSRLYLQVPADERLEAWPDERIWEELQRRVALDGWTLAEGAVLEKGITGMRSFVVEPMAHGRLFLAGDSAHIVPPTGAKGLNLAVADVTVLADALIDWYASGNAAGLAGYSETCLRRVWRAEHFSYWMTSMLHRLGDDPFDLQIQLSQLRYLVSSEAAARTLAENYVGLPVNHSALAPG